METLTLVYVLNFMQEPTVKLVNISKKKIRKKFNYIILNYLDTNACSNNPCLFGSTCTPSATGTTYTCSCGDGYSGTNCQTCKISPKTLQVIYIMY